ncbi:VCBS [Beggiatoa sp. PS]|nr:VCBS [Beggiatoa sp. PS]
MMKTTNPITHPIFSLLVAMLLAATPSLVQAAAPGGISSNLQLWLKADAGTSTTTDGSTLTNWTDQSTNAYTASNTAGDGQTSPTFRNNTLSNINFNPVIEFDGVANGLDLASNYIYSYSSNDGLTFVAVVKPDVEPDEVNFIFDFGRFSNTGYGFVYANDALQIYTPKNYGGKASNGTTHSYSTNPVIYIGKVDFGNEQRLYLNGTSTYNANITLTQLTSNEITEGSIHSAAPDQGPVTIGRQSKNINDNDRLFDGKIAEIILYDADLSDTDRNKVQSYLALKYGITLDNTINYRSSDGSTIYISTDTHSGYTNDIAGIGTDNGSALNQPQSRSVNSDSIITITGSGIADGNFLIWGNNDGALTFSSTEVPGGGKRLAREWIVAETGDVGSVTLSFDLSNVAGANLTDATKFSLLTDTDGNFSDAIETTGATINGNTLKFTAINFSDGQYFSLAYNNVPVAGFGTALDFDGVDDYIDLSGINITNSSFTFEAWSKRDGNGTGDAIIDVGVKTTNAGIAFGFNSANDFGFHFVNNGLGIDSAFTDNNWHHWAGVF